MRERLEELLVLLPEVKKRALFDLYHEITRLRDLSEESPGGCRVVREYASAGVRVCVVCVYIYRAASVFQLLYQITTD